MAMLQHGRVLILVYKVPSKLDPASPAQRCNRSSSLAGKWH